MNLKRTLTSIAAASLVLGTMAPVAMAATTTSYSFSQRHVTVDGTNLANPWGFVSGGTNYFPIYYLQSAIGSLVPGATATWDGKNLMINIAGFDASKLMGPTVPGTNGIYINGTLVQKFTRIVTNDKGTKIQTSFAPIYSLFGVLEQIGLKSTWSANGTWGIAPALAKLTIAGTGTIGVGGSDTLSLTGTDSAGNALSIDQSKVTWSATGGVLSSAGVFAGTAAGTYTVTATYMGMSTTGSVVVYGAAAGLTMKAASANLVANAASSDVVTATVVDANGNAVSNYNGTFTVSGANGSLDANNSYAPYIVTANGAWIEGGTVSSGVETFNVVNGVAKITIVAPSSTAVGQSDTITANWTDPSSATHQANATVTYTAQTATSLKLTPASTMAAASSSDSFTLQVLDQTGNPMQSGTFNVTLSVAGTAYLPGQLQTEQMTVSGGSSIIVVSTPPYANGTVTVSATGSIVGGATLTPASSSINVGTPATAAKLALTQNSNSSFVNGKMTADYAKTNPAGLVTGNVQDANGMNTGTGLPATVAYSIVLAGSTVDSGTVNVNQTTGAFTVPFGATEDVAGTYTITVSDTGLTSATSSVVVVPGTAAKLAIGPSVNSTVLASNPSTTLTATVQDAEGNTVAQSGTAVTFTVYNQTASTTPTLNGATNAVIANTNAAGTASVTLALPTGVGNKTEVQAGATGFATVTSGWISEVGIATSSLSVTPGATSFAAGVAPSSTTPLFTIKATDNYGDLANGDVLQVTLPTALVPSGDLSADFYGGTASLVSGTTYNVVTNGNAVTFYGAAPQAVGTYTVSVKDLSTPTSVTGSGTVNVTQGTLTGFDAFSGSTNLVTNSVYLAAGSSMAITISPVDGGNNVVSTDASYTVNLPSLGAGLEWRSGTAGGTVANAVYFAPAQSSQTVYLVNSNSSGIVTVGNLNLTGAPTAFAANSTVTATNTTLTASNNVATVTVTVKDASGNVLAGQPVYLSVTAGGSNTAGTLSASTVYTNSQGIASFTYTGPATLGMGTDTISVKVGSVGAVSLTSVSVIQ